MRNCEYCGTEIWGTQLSCPKCGAPYSTKKEVVPPPAPSRPFPPPRPKSSEYDEDKELEEEELEEKNEKDSSWVAVLITLIAMAVAGALIWFAVRKIPSPFDVYLPDPTPTPQIVFPGVSEEQMPTITSEKWPSIKDLPNAMNFSEFTPYDMERVIACNWVEERTTPPTEFYPNGRTWAEEYPLTLVMKDDVIIGVNVRKAPYDTSPILQVLSKDVRVLSSMAVGEWMYFPQRIRVTEGEGGWLKIYMGYDENYALFIMPGWVHASNFRMITDQDADYSEWMCY